MRLVVQEKFMRQAIELAKKSAQVGDYAVGAVVVKRGAVVASGTTKLKRSNDPTLHAEIVAIRQACKKLHSRFLEECILYTTHEPCAMCASAVVWAKMQGIVFGASIADAKNRGSKKFSWRQINIACKVVLSRSQPKVELTGGVLRQECIKLFGLSQ